MSPFPQICTGCPLGIARTIKSPNLPVKGTPKPLLYVIGNNPDMTDDRNGEIFSGRSSTDFIRCLKDLDADIHKIRFSNAIRCLPEKNIIGKRELEICSQRTVDDINETEPNAILAMGEEALKTLWPNAYTDVYTITRTRGGSVPYRLKSGKIIPVIPTLTAGYIGRPETSAEMKQAWVDDIALAWDNANTDIDSFIEWDESGLYDEPEKIILIKTVAQVKELFERLRTATITAFDFETTDLKPWIPKVPHINAPKLFSIAFAFEQEKEVWALPLYQYWSEKITKVIFDSLGKWFTESCPDQIKIAHNTKFDLLWGLTHTAEEYTGLKTPDIQPVGKYHDTALMAWILDERPGMSKLKVAAWKFLGKSDWSIDVKNVLKYPVNEVLHYNALDSWYTLKLYRYFESEVLKDESYERLYTNVLLPAALSFLKIESRGCYVDIAKKEEMANRLNAEAEELLHEIRINAGDQDLNPASPEQMSRYFVDECKYKLLKKTKKGWSVDAAALEHIVTVYDDIVAKQLLELRGIQKLNGTYVTGLDDKIYIDGKIHGGYNLTGTVTGRTSSNDPNYQNFPKRKHKEVRGIIVPPEGYKIVSIDYGQIESRLFGVITGDPDFIAALWDDWDIHLDNSRILFGDARAKEMRGPVKNGTFALLYGAGDRKVSETTGAPLEAIAKLRKLIFEKYKLLKIWQSETASFEKRNGYVESLFGRRRRAPMGYTEMLNHTTQSTASDMTLSAMNVLGNKYMVAFMIHDDLSFYIKEEDLEESIMEIAQVMITVPWTHLCHSKWMKAYVPLQVEASVGDNWADLYEVLKVSSTDFGFMTMKDSIEAANKLIAGL
jgi:uracil-DNA glycosylase family 4